MSNEIYKGYVIKGFDDGTFDIEEMNGDLIDGEFESLNECKAAIDGFEQLMCRKGKFKCGINQRVLLGGTHGAGSCREMNLQT